MAFLVGFKRNPWHLVPPDERARKVDRCHASKPRMMAIMHPSMLSPRAQRDLKKAQVQRTVGVRPPPRTEAKALLASSMRFGKSFASPRDVRRSARESVRARPHSLGGGGMCTRLQSGWCVSWR